MKKIASILVFAFAITINTYAQKKADQKRPKFSTEQRTNLMVKKMTLKLDLTKKQQKEVCPIFDAQIAERKAMMQKRKAAKNAKRIPNSDERYALKSEILDKQIAMKTKMKNILNPVQFEKFEKMKKQKLRGIKWMKRKIHKKGMKIKKLK
jgi:protein CpxP